MNGIGFSTNCGTGKPVPYKGATHIFSTALASREARTVFSAVPNRDIAKLSTALTYGGSFPVSSVLSIPGYQRYVYW